MKNNTHDGGQRLLMHLHGLIQTIKILHLCKLFLYLCVLRTFEPCALRILVGHAQYPFHWEWGSYLWKFMLITGIKAPYELINLYIYSLNISISNINISVKKNARTLQLNIVLHSLHDLCHIQHQYTASVTTQCIHYCMKHIVRWQIHKNWNMHM